MAEKHVERETHQGVHEQSTSKAKRSFNLLKRRFSRSRFRFCCSSQRSDRTSRRELLEQLRGTQTRPGPPVSFQSDTGRGRSGGNSITPFFEHAGGL